MGKNWYENSFRKLFCDFHAPTKMRNVGADYDAELWAEQLEDAGAQAVSSFAKCYYGWAHYRKCKVGFVHPGLAEGRDLLGETVEACHRRDIKVIAYFHTSNGQPLAKLHPEWLTVEADGTVGWVEGMYLCQLSPYVEEHMIPQMVEIAEGYEIDAIFLDGPRALRACFCDSCRKRFEADIGEDLPHGPEDPLWLDFVRWKMSAYRQMRQRVLEEVHSVRPDLLVAVNWLSMPRQPETPPEGIGFHTADIHPEDQLFKGSYYSCYFGSFAVPFDILNTLFMKWWDDWAVKPGLRIKQECAAILANGGRTFPGYHANPDGRMEPAVMECMKDVFGFVREREEGLTDTRPVHYVGVFHSLSSNDTHGGAFSGDETASMGVHKVLLDGRIPHTFVNEDALPGHINDFAAIIMPDQRLIPERLIPAIVEFVSRGGVLIATHLTGTLDAQHEDCGDFALRDVLGVSRAGLIGDSHAYIVVQDERIKRGYPDMPILTWGQFVDVKPEGSETLATIALPQQFPDETYVTKLEMAAPAGERLASPAITLREFGAGKAVYISPPIFYAFAEHNQWPLKVLVQNLVSELLPEPPVRVEGEGSLEVTLREGDGFTAVHLVNHGGSCTLLGSNAITESVPRARNLQVHLRAQREPSEVILIPSGEPLPCRRNGPYLVTELDELHVHSAVIFRWRG